MLLKRGSVDSLVASHTNTYKYRYIPWAVKHELYISWNILSVLPEILVDITAIHFLPSLAYIDVQPSVYRYIQATNDITMDKNLSICEGLK